MLDVASKKARVVAVTPEAASSLDAPLTKTRLAVSGVVIVPEKVGEARGALSARAAVRAALSLIEPLSIPLHATVEVAQAAAPETIFRT